jgi:hypothetical protein
MTTQGSSPRRRESTITEVFFVAGSAVIVVGLVYSIRMSWPSIDPLSLAMLVGMGLLLVVVCERLRLILKEVEAIAASLDRVRGEAPPMPQDQVGAESGARAAEDGRGAGPASASRPDPPPGP